MRNQRFTPVVNAVVCLIALTQASHAASNRTDLNVLVFTADDLNWNSVGVYGCPLKATPALDQLAKQGIRFEQAHVVTTVCIPSRTAMMTARYPHRTSVQADIGNHRYAIRPEVQNLQQVLQQAGYFTGMLNKHGHLLRPERFPLDMAGRCGRDPAEFGKWTADAISAAERVGKPFFLLVNAPDPHRPWPGSERDKHGTNATPAQIYRADEIPLPGFLPDLPDIRKEVAQYFASVRRGDQCLAATLDALQKAGREEDTLVVFLSDHGASLPGAKETLTRNGTKTPLVVRWPSQVRPGAVDRDHCIASVDLAPTILDVLNLPPMSSADGRSFKPLLEGQPQAGREHVVTVFHNTPGSGHGTPTRAVNTARYGYIYNAWSNGKTRFQDGDWRAGLTWKTMVERAKSNPDVAARVQYISYRVPEELYDYQADPDGRRNLIDDPKYVEVRARLRAILSEWMEQKADPLQETYAGFLATTPDLSEQ